MIGGSGPLVVDRRTDRALATTVLVVAGVLTCQYVPPVDLGLDGAGYFNIANHVARGHGLVTSLSMYHQGLDPLPQPSTVYPAWPWALGAAIRVAGPALAGTWLPKALYVIDTALVYLLLSRFCHTPGSSPRTDGRGSLDPAFARIGALLFALNPVFFWATSLPYSEGLAFACIALALLSCHRAATVPGTRAALAASAAAGLFAALSYLTRFQAIGVSLAVVLALVVALPGPRRWSCVLSASLAAAVPMLTYAGWLSRRPGFEPAMLLNFAAYRQQKELPPFDYLVPSPTLGGWIADRLSGVLVAFDPWSPDSYFATFGVLAAVPPLVLAAFAFKPRAALAFLASSARNPRNAAILATLLAGIFLTLPLHAVHGLHWRPWLFGWRHGLSYWLLIIPALGFMLGRLSPIVRGLGQILAGIAAVQGGFRVLDVIDDVRPSPPGLRAAAAFLDAHPGARALAVEPQSLSVHTDAGLYWSACWTRPQVLRALRSRVHIDFVLIRREERSCAAFVGLWPDLDLVQTLDYGRLMVYRWRGGP